jgi:hypothetical protein
MVVFAPWEVTSAFSAAGTFVAGLKMATPRLGGVGLDSAQYDR